MMHMCPNCHTVFDSGNNYCSERCAREVRRHRRQFLLGAMLGALVLALAIYTAPKTEFRPEPRLPISLAEIRQLAHDEFCPICAGKTKVDCNICIDGNFFSWAPARRAAVALETAGCFVRLAKVPANLKMRCQWPFLHRERNQPLGKNHKTTSHF